MSKKIFTERIRKAIREKEITQKELSKMLGVDQTQISNYMTGKSFPTIENFEKLLKILDKDANYFFEPMVQITHKGTGDIVGGDKIITSGEAEEIKNRLAALERKLKKK